MDLSERKSTTTTNRHPWELARGEFFLKLLERHGVLRAAASWLDAGSGDAWFAQQLRPRILPEATLTCWDPNYSREDVAHLTAAADGIEFVTERPDAHFDLILLLDVIEHVEDDAGFVSAIVDELLAERGMVVVSVPAHPALFSSHDSALRHHRRYSRAACRGLLERAGLRVVADGGLFHSLLPVRAAAVAFERGLHARASGNGIGDWRGNALVTRALTRALATDAAVGRALSRRGVFLPGLSYWALCTPRRP